MSDPVTFFAIASAVIGAVSSIQQGKAQKRAADAQATVLEQQSTRDRQIAASEEEDFRRRVRRLRASNRAATGASGVTTSGTPALLDEDLVAEAELQSLRIRSSGEATATRREQEAGFERFGGRVAKSSGLARAGATVLSGLGRVDFGAGAAPGGVRPSRSIEAGTGRRAFV